MKKMNIQFEKASARHIDTIFGWLSEVYVQAFWDNTQAHKDDILNFIGGRTQPSSYADGKYVYWIASDNGYPFAMFMTIQATLEDHVNDIKLMYLSKTGHSYGIEYMIGDQGYFDKGYGAKTLSEFLVFFRREFDPKADTFLIDPASDNPRAKHVYMKAGFEHVADFIMSGEVSGAGKPHHLLIKKFALDVQLLPATKIIADQNIVIRLATSVDIEHMVAMSYQKRRDYEKAQPQFWKWAGVDAEVLQAKWFSELIARDEHVILVATDSNEKIMGFIIGRLMPAPAVYNPGGLTLMIDDYCIENEHLWGSVGIKLINEIKVIAKAKQAVQILVVCGAHDKVKSQFLKNRGLAVASEWHVGSIV
ncbi:MAG TPA: GNAT family N-acetyltransferase [Gammaproteobacteria bacterium]|nr:GNAT family N-acetyltransferase [Gammaproteobacteria bacterium]